MHRPVTRTSLRDRYCEYAPNRRAELEKIREGTPNAVPFLFGLIAYQEEYSGIEEYVSHSIEPLTIEEKFVTLAVALSHRYAGVSIADDFFANGNLRRQGPAESLCKHARVFVDWIGETELGPAATEGLEDSLEEIEADVPDELAGLFDENTIIFELVESARGGGHDGAVCPVALAVDGVSDEDDSDE